MTPIAEMDTPSIRPEGSGRRQRLPGGMRGILPLLVFLLAWELVARALVFPPALFPPFTIVSGQLVKLALAGTLVTDIVTTTLRASAGLAIAVVMGVCVGLAMARIRWVNWFFQPLIGIGFPMPTITLIPVFILWFGVGHASKILLVALTCFFPVVVATGGGARQAGQALVWSALAMGTKERDILWRVILPAAVPFILSGVRIALPLSLIVEFVTEMVGGGGGLGYSLMYGYRFLETPTVFAVLLTVMMVGFLLDRLLLYVRYLLVPWDVEAGFARAEA